jgi:hypothetical protein
MRARVKLNHDTSDPFGRILYGSWWWMVSVEGHGSKTGFARTELKARLRADKAAAKLSKLPENTWVDYEFETGGDMEKDWGKLTGWCIFCRKGGQEIEPAASAKLGKVVCVECAEDL